MPSPAALALAQDLIRRPSITPTDAGALDVLGAALERLGFSLRRMQFGAVDNLFAVRGSGGPHLCFAGHTDVVPPGDGAAWSVDPFAGVVREGKLYGRGAADMKGAIACFVAALEGFSPRAGTISLLITGDEEGPALDGTAKALAALQADGVRFDHCLIGEPTSEAQIGDVVKVGRRGSYNAVIEAEGRQGHAAYPQLALNPLPPLLDLLNLLRSHALDEGAPGFEASNLQITSIDVANPAQNVIPARASAKFNVRFNTHHTGESVGAWIESLRLQAASAHPQARLRVTGRATGEAFYSTPGPFAEIVCAAAGEIAGAAPRVTTSGGTSDARFLHKACPVAELGLLNQTAHKVDEAVPLADLEALQRIYRRVLELYFDRFG